MSSFPNPDHTRPAERGVCLPRRVTATYVWLQQRRRRSSSWCAARAGFALPLTILVMLAVASLAAAAAFTTMGTTMVQNAYTRDERLGRHADEGIEQVRAMLNGIPSLYPDSGYVAIEEDAAVENAAGDTIPGLTRSVYVGPIGVTSGQYGVHGAVVAVTRDAGGGVAVRRGNIVQESFSKYAYFTNTEGTIVFGGGDQIFGPVHSNDDIEIHNSPGAATFFGPVTTGGRILNRYRASFRDGYTERVPLIPLPDVADLDRLRAQAQAGGTAFTGWSIATEGRARVRIEFLGIDLNGDGDNTDGDEGFIRVYQASSSSYADWVVGMRGTAYLNTSNGLDDSENCGHWHTDGRFYTAAEDGDHTWSHALTRPDSRCFPGGAPELTSDDAFQPTDAYGAWLHRGATLLHPALASRDDQAYLFAITRELNPEFKGVIHVSGDVAISGTVRGRVTIAATGDIVLVDDLTYAIDPSVGSCEDIAGLFAGGDIVVANTPINAPARVGSNYYTFDDTSDEFIHAFVLTLNEFTVEGYNSGHTTKERCEGTAWGRGCLYLTGGIIQRTRGPVGLSSGTGYLKRYSYDACGLSQPPPYFPTTGRFARGPYLEIDPVGFDIGDYFEMITAGG